MNPDRKLRWLFRGYVVFLLLSILASCAVSLGLIVVAAHFIAKFW